MSEIGGYKPVVLPSGTTTNNLKATLNATTNNTKAQSTDNIFDATNLTDIQKQDLSTVDYIKVDNKYNSTDTFLSIKHIPPEDRAAFLEDLKSKILSQKEIKGSSFNPRHFVNMTTETSFKVGENTVDLKKIDLEANQVDKAKLPENTKVIKIDESGNFDKKELANSATKKNDFQSTLYVEKDGRVFEMTVDNKTLEKMKSGENIPTNIMFNKKDATTNAKSLNLSGIINDEKLGSLNSLSKNNAIIKAFEEIGINFDDGISSDELGQIMEHVWAEASTITGDNKQNKYLSDISSAINRKLDKVYPENPSKEDLKSEKYENLRNFLRENGADEKDIKNAKDLGQSINLSFDKTFKQKGGSSQEANNTDILNGSISVRGDLGKSIEFATKEVTVGKQKLNYSGDGNSCGVGQTEFVNTLRDINVPTVDIVKNSVSEKEKQKTSYVNNTSEIFEVKPKEEPKYELSFKFPNFFQMNLTAIEANPKAVEGAGKEKLISKDDFKKATKKENETFDNLVKDKPDVQIVIKADGSRLFDENKDYTPAELQEQRSISANYNNDENTFTISGTADVRTGMGTYREIDVPPFAREYIVPKETSINNDTLSLFRAINAYIEFVNNADPETQKSVKSKTVKFELNEEMRKTLPPELVEKLDEGLSFNEMHYTVAKF